MKNKRKPKKYIYRMVYEYPTPWKGLASGIYEITTNLADMLPKNVDTVVSCGSPGTKVVGTTFAQKSENGSSQEHAGVFIHQNPRSRRFISIFFTSSLFSFLHLIVTKMQKKVALVHGHNHMTFWFNLYKLLFGFLDKTPYIITFHSTSKGRANSLATESSEVPFHVKYFEWPLHSFSDRLAYKLANTVICTSEDIKNDLENLYGKRDAETRVITDGYNEVMFRPDIPDVRKSRNLSNKKIIMFSGTISDRNRINVLVEAFHNLRIKEKYLVLIGDGDTNYIEQLRRKLRAKNLLQDSLIIQDPSYLQLPPYYVSADLFVFNSVYEGSIQPILQAMSVQKPSIVSGVTLPKDLLNSPLVTYTDTETSVSDLTALIEKKLKDKINTSSKVLEKHTWLNVSSKYLSIYSKYLN